MNSTRTLNVTDGALDISEPGDGTSYQALAFRVHGRVQCGTLGAISDGWVVVCGMTARAYLFADGDAVSEDYIAEKFAIHNPHTIRHVTEQVARIINGAAILNLSGRDDGQNQRKGG